MAKVKGRGRRSTVLSAIEWTDYPKIPTGEYSAYCAWAGKYEGGIGVVARVPMWLSLGTGEKPRAPRRSNYLKEWVHANGGSPSRGDRLSPRVFVHRIARVEVGDTTKGPAPYSVVKKILLWETGKSGHSVSKSHSQGRQPERARDE
jgi:hypothetical protein